MMVLVIGGIFQGKLEYVMESYRLTQEDVMDFRYPDEGWDDGKQCLNHLELLIRRWLQEGKSQEQLEGDLLPLLNDKIVICDDVSCGIVPIDPFEREYREAVGRILCKIAASADRVVRIQCGIPQEIKGAGR